MCFHVAADIVLRPNDQDYSPPFSGSYHATESEPNGTIATDDLAKTFDNSWRTG